LVTVIFGNTVFIPYTPLFILPFIFLTGYVIARHHILNVRVIASEVFIFLGAIAVLLQLPFAQTLLQRISSISVFLFILIFGIFLTRSEVREVAQREEIERLAEDLAAANERLRNLDQVKSEFVSIASHQLRAPVTAIKGYASLIVEGSFGKVPVSIQEAVQRIFESSKYMASSIDDFLNVSRIEQGKMKYDYKIFDVTALAAQTSTEFLPIASKKNLALKFDEATPHMAYADQNKSKQIMTNLVDNAIKYTQSGTITVSVSENEKEKKVLYTVTDTGIGISAEDQEKLFAKFSRASNANSANVQGTGLGLYVAREMARAMNGTIRISSEGVGKGSISVFELPSAEGKAS
jgi:signal transduction histidine kinase